LDAIERPEQESYPITNRDHFPVRYSVSTSPRHGHFPCDATYDGDHWSATMIADVVHRNRSVIIRSWEYPAGLAARKPTESSHGNRHRRVLNSGPPGTSCGVRTTGVAIH
jgi:hypothetical protein